jgi:hypothetical protein
MGRKRKTKPALARGLTAADYHRLRRRIEDGEYTWETAENLGLCLPRRQSKKPLGRPILKTGRVASTPKTGGQT